MKLRGEFAVHLRNGDQLVTFLPGDDVPEWAAKQITNPLAWGDTSESPEKPSAPVKAPDSGDGPPPQGGSGASRQRWADYAESKDIEVQDDWKREDIIAACEKAGVPV
ncbi:MULTISPECIES: hypothetical protein [Nocardia]|uniref:hypothetical protein n=1 Tax=Nocardia TaxID=1817 RepID=UPI0024538F57|nr:MULTISPECIES: hypothetical protein [Nocardia]